MPKRKGSRSSCYQCRFDVVAIFATQNGAKMAENRYRNRYQNLITEALLSFAGLMGHARKIDPFFERHFFGQEAAKRPVAGTHEGPPDGMRGPWGE